MLSLSLSHHALLVLFLFLATVLSLFLSLSSFLSIHTVHALETHMFAQLIVIFAIAPHLHTHRFSTLVPVHLHTNNSYLPFAAVVTLPGSGWCMPTVPRSRANPSVEFCPRSNKYQQRDSYTGSNPSLSYTLINPTALRSRGIHADDLTTGVIGKHPLLLDLPSTLPASPSTLTIHPPVSPV